MFVRLDRVVRCCLHILESQIVDADLGSAVCGRCGKSSSFVAISLPTRVLLVYYPNAELVLINLDPAHTQSETVSQGTGLRLQLLLPNP